MHPVSSTTEVESKGKTSTKKSYEPVYIPYKMDGQSILLPQEADMSRKDNLNLLYNLQPLGTRTNEEYDYLENKHFDTEAFQYSHEASKNQIMVQGVYIGNTSPILADIKTQPY